MRAEAMKQFVVDLALVRGRGLAKHLASTAPVASPDDHLQIELMQTSKHDTESSQSCKTTKLAPWPSRRSGP